MVDRYRVVVVDDDIDVRTLVRRHLERSGWFTVVAEAGDGEEGVAAATLHQPQVTLLDIRMPGSDGLAAVPLIRAAAPSCTVVMLSGLQVPDIEADVRAAGASAFLPKHDTLRDLPSDLLRILEAVDSRPPEQQRSLNLPGALTSGHQARRWIRTTLAEWGISELLDEAELLASELINNAVVHATSAVTVRLRLAGKRLRVEVTDTGHGSLHRQETTLEDTDGRGLFLVEALSRAWGTAAGERGKLVWFELDTVDGASGVESVGPAGRAGGTG